MSRTAPRGKLLECDRGALVNVRMHLSRCEKRERLDATAAGSQARLTSGPMRAAGEWIRDLHTDAADAYARQVREIDELLGDELPGERDAQTALRAAPRGDRKDDSR